MTSFVEYVLLESNVHYYKCKENIIASLVAYIAHSRKLLQIEKQHVPDKIPQLLILLDLSEAQLPSIEELVSITIDQRHTAFYPKDSVSRRIAYLSDEANLSDKIAHITAIVSAKNKRKFFRTDEKQQAIDWLLEEDKTV